MMSSVTPTQSAWPRARSAVTTCVSASVFGADAIGGTCLSQKEEQCVRRLCLGTDSDTECSMTLLCLDHRVQLRRLGFELVLEPGQLAFTSRPCALDIQVCGQGQLLLVQLPASAIRARGGQSHVPLVGPISSDIGLGALVRRLVLDLDHNGTMMADDDLAVMQETLFNLVARLLSQQAPPARSNVTIPVRIRSLIEARLADPELCPESIARACGTSVRSLQRRFAGTGRSISQWIKHRRLERCREDLCDPRWRNLSVASIAFRWGFVDPAHFSRAFKQQYGFSPRALRSDAGRHSPGCTDIPAAAV